MGCLRQGSVSDEPPLEPPPSSNQDQMFEVMPTRPAVSLRPLPEPSESSPDGRSSPRKVEIAADKLGEPPSSSSVNLVSENSAPPKPPSAPPRPPEFEALS